MQCSRVLLPAPEGSDDGHDLAGVDVQIDALEHVKRPPHVLEALLEALDDDQRLCHDVLHS